MWTPKRLLILLGGTVLFMGVFAIYAYFLGGIDGLPLLPIDYLRGEIEPPTPPVPPVGGTETKLKRAFGNECDELKRTIILDLRSKGMLLAANQFDIEADGRVKLTQFSAALFPKSRDDTKFPEINTVQCQTAFLTLNQPVSNLTELSNRKIIGVELRGNRGITMINNRRTAEKTDDIEVLITNGPMFYEEKKNLIWTDGYVRLLDTQTQPNPTKITAQGMELKLTEETGPNRPKTAKAPKNAPKTKSDALSGLEMLHLKSNVEMHLYVDSTSGFLAGSPEFGKKSDKAPGAAGKTSEKSHIVIKTSGPFYYNLTRELAWFDSPAPQGNNVPASPEQVLVSREHKVGKSETYDQLLCDHLELQFRRKAADPKARPDAASRSADKEIESALATTRTKEIVLTMDSENLEAYGQELHFRAATATSGPQTILKGAPTMNAVKDCHKIKARELHIIGADKAGNGQQVFAKGPGQIDMWDKNNKARPYPTHALWKDSLISVKEKVGDKLLDVLTLTGDAGFIDEEHRQELHGQRLQVWLETAGGAGKKREVQETAKQKLHKVEAWEKVSASSPEMIVRYTNHLVIRFKHEPAVDATLPESLPAIPGGEKTPPLPGPSGDRATPLPQPGKAPDKSPEKARKPIELQANDVVAYVTTQGAKNQLQELVTEGTVHIHKEGEDAKDKGIDITGEMLNLVHHPRGDTLFVFGDGRKPAQLQLNDLVLVGPKVTINQKDNIAEVEGAGVMNMPSNTTFDGGRPTKQGTRLEVHWNRDMIFNGKYADFHGGVQAYQDNASMKCENLQVTLDRVISFKEGQKSNQGAKVEKLLCDKKVYVQEETKNPATKKYVLHNRLEAGELTIDNQEGPIIARGPGKVYHLAMGSSENPIAGPGQQPNAKGSLELKLTRIDFEGRMFSNNKDNSRNAKFYDNVEVYHFPAEEPNAQMNPNNPPAGGFYLRCEVLNVFTRQIEGKSSQMMHAKGKVFFRTQEFFGRAEVLKYDESQDTVIFEGTPGNPATLYKKKAAGQEPQEIKGSKILYNRKTGVFQLDGGKLIQSWLWEERGPLAPCSPSFARGGWGREPSLALARLHAYRQDEQLFVLGPITGHDR